MLQYRQTAEVFSFSRYVRLANRRSSQVLLSGGVLDGFVEQHRQERSSLSGTQQGYRYWPKARTSLVLKGLYLLAS